MDLDDHPFSPKNVAYESGRPDAGERKWLAFCKDAEAALGHSLDGDDQNQSGCGYSMDEAFGAFEAGMTAAEYAEEVKGRDRYRPESSAPSV